MNRRPNYHRSVILFCAITGRRDWLSREYERFVIRLNREAKRRKIKPPTVSWIDAAQPREDD